MAQTSVVNPGNSINDQVPAAPRKRSKFSLPFVQMGTSRFGEVGVCYVADTVPGDHFQNINRSKVDTLSFKSPIGDSVRQRRDFFHVPYSAILPKTWERFITQPNRGDDIPALAGTGINFATNTLGSKFANSMGSAGTKVTNVYQWTGSGSSPTNPFVAIRFLIILEYFFSYGSLMNELGYNLARYCYVEDALDPTQVVLTWGEANKTFDQFFDEWIAILLENFHSVTMIEVADNTKTHTYYFTPRAGAPEEDLNMRDFLEDLRDGLIMYDQASSGSLSSFQYNEGKSYTDVAGAFETFFGYTVPTGMTVGQITKNRLAFTAPACKMNLARLFAYQIACAHFYTNDNVDNVYSANLYRENLKAIIDAKFSGATKTYSWNGVKMDYEPCSAYWFSMLISQSSTTPLVNYFDYLSVIFSHRSSLKYVDFFTGSRTAPLAVGNTSIPVQSSTYVNVVDVTRNILMQRFLNAVNRSGRKISNYIGELFGVSVRKDICDPSFLVHYDDYISPINIENTGSDQLTEANSQTSRLVGSGRFEVSFDSDSFGILIGLSYYDYVRKYAYACDPCVQKQDRFDLFNPFLENAGDQPLLASTLDPKLSTTATFGYQQRYMEYKQTIARVVGGFVHNLPGFAFVVKDIPRHSYINPIDIRSRNRELDDYFISLTGYSLGSYFHFINRFESDCEVSRDMSTDAQIL